MSDNTKENAAAAEAKSSGRRRRKGRGHVNPGLDDEKLFQLPLTISRLIEAVGWEHINTH
jgi:hypothetical protein